LPGVRPSEEDDLQTPTADPVSLCLARAREQLALGDDEAAERAYLDALRIDGASFEALNDLGVLAHRRGRRTAARLAHERCLKIVPQSSIAHVNLGNILLEEGAGAEARAHYRTALAVDPRFAPAHRGLARAYDVDGDARAGQHWRLAGDGGYRRLPHRGVGPGLPVLLITSAKLGNVATAPWLDDRLFDAHIIEAENFPASERLPAHAVAFNLIADADLCADALNRAHEMAARSTAPVINAPARVAATGRIESARRLGALADVETPEMRLVTRQKLIETSPFGFPLLLRSPGFHAGRHFLRVETSEQLPAALAKLPGEMLLAMSVLDARGADGYHRKYRAMSIGGAWLPLHLAISGDWKVHYFSAEMAAGAEHRDEERRFLEDMSGVLGRRGCAALTAIAETVGLDYFGVDFAIARDGRLRVFEANAAMAMLDPPEGSIWDYRRAPLAEARAAARSLVTRAALASRIA
jgi:Tfp pilus assembly protein PilF